MSVDLDILRRKVAVVHRTWRNSETDDRDLYQLMADFVAGQIAAYQAVSAPAPAAPIPPTVRVRIAVAVSAGHTFAQVAANYESDAEAKARVLNFLDERKSRIAHIITADVPLPFEVLVEGEVQP